MKYFNLTYKSYLFSQAAQNIHAFQNCYLHKTILVYTSLRYPRDQEVKMLFQNWTNQSRTMLWLFLTSQVHTLLSCT
jgi:hypothetical protein